MTANERARHAWELYRALAARLEPELQARDLSERREAEIAAIRRLRAGSRRAG
ncbi:MAG: hypothetical protein JRH20_32130 [Deltaproteobacteria bacterium]|nr:hypothetical protein [Deltaproteobacteria bacterium]